MRLAQFELHADIEERHWWFVARRRILREVIGAVLPPSKEATIVDVGCGTGANLATLAADYRCVGIDTSADAIALARRRFPNVHFLEGFAPADLGGEMQRAQLVLLTDVLEHVPDDFALLSDLLAAARPGTHFVVTVPADLSLWSKHDESFGHYRRYDLARFQAAWQGLPVTPLLASYFNARLYRPIRAIRSYHRLRSTSAGRAGTDFEMPPERINRALANIFAGEAKRLVGQLRGQDRPFARGVSLIALLRREEGRLERRCKPAVFAADFYDPAAAQLSAISV